MPSCDSFVFDEVKLTLVIPRVSFAADCDSSLETAVKPTATVFSHSRKLLLSSLRLFFPTELSTGSLEEEFNTPVAQDPTDLMEDTPVAATTVAITEAEDTEVEWASEKQ